MHVKTNTYNTHVVVYKLLKLMPLLHLATSTVERIFLFAMKYVNNKLRSKIGRDQYIYLNAWLFGNIYIFFIYYQPCLCVAKRETI